MVVRQPLDFNSKKCLREKENNDTFVVAVHAVIDSGGQNLGTPHEKKSR